MQVQSGARITGAAVRAVSGNEGGKRAKGLESSSVREAAEPETEEGDDEEFKEAGGEVGSCGKGHTKPRRKRVVSIPAPVEFDLITGGNSLCFVKGGNRADVEADRTRALNKDSSKRPKKCGK